MSSEPTVGQMKFSIFFHRNRKHFFPVPLFPSTQDPTGSESSILSVRNKSLGTESRWLAELTCRTTGVSAKMTCKGKVCQLLRHRQYLRFFQFTNTVNLSFLKPGRAQSKISCHLLKVSENLSSVMSSNTLWVKLG